MIPRKAIGARNRCNPVHSVIRVDFGLRLQSFQAVECTCLHYDLSRRQGNLREDRRSALAAKVAIDWLPAITLIRVNDRLALLIIISFAHDEVEGE